jgi:NAD-dependent SIR2 family protein deacetylase
MPESTPLTTRGSTPDGGIDELHRFLRGRRAVVLTGAGCSTESGIPDYRGPDGRHRERAPMRYQEFMRDARARARYWARSMVGWPRFSRASPNGAHRAVANLESLGFVAGVVTQNVDGLHQAAGSRKVTELHGSLADVRCTGCGSVERRDDVQARLEALNPSFAAEATRAFADGDAELPAGAERGFRVPPCRGCGGVLKPDVVFFGENVPRERLAEAWRVYEAGETLLVLGSSLAVFSGRRFVLKAAQEAKPVAIVNLGPTRGDETAALKVEGRVGELLPELVRALDGAAGAAAPQRPRPYAPLGPGS